MHVPIVDNHCIRREKLVLPTATLLTRTLPLIVESRMLNKSTFQYAIAVKPVPVIGK